MRGVGADDAALERQKPRQAREGTALRSVTVDDVGPQRSQARLDLHQRRYVARMRQPPDRQPNEPERQPRGELCQDAIGLRAAGQGIRDNADLMAAVGLLARDIEDVAKRPPRGARSR
jgi:hypothetical protein